MPWHRIYVGYFERMVRAAIVAEGGPERKISEQRLLFLGAGEAGVGIANLVVTAMVEEGLSPVEARRRCWFVDSHGLVVAERDDLAEHKLPYAHQHPRLNDLLSAVNELQPTAIIGVSGQPRTFTILHINPGKLIKIRVAPDQDQRRTILDQQRQDWIVDVA